MLLSLQVALHSRCPDLSTVKLAMMRTCVCSALLLLQVVAAHHKQHELHSWQSQRHEACFMVFAEEEMDIEEQEDGQMHFADLACGSEQDLEWPQDFEELEAPEEGQVVHQDFQEGSNAMQTFEEGEDYLGSEEEEDHLEFEGDPEVLQECEEDGKFPEAFGDNDDVPQGFEEDGEVSQASEKDDDMLQGMEEETGMAGNHHNLDLQRESTACEVGL